MLRNEVIEKDLLTLLSDLKKDPFFSDFNLAGGTSLALQIGHRKSIDLDMFTQNPFNVQDLLEYLERKFKFYTYFMSSNSLKGNIRGINVDFIAHQYPLVKEINLESGFGLYSCEDIAAMKLNAIVGNGTRVKDFIDIYFLLNKFSLENLLDFYQAKYDSRNEIMVLKSLIYFNEVDTNDWPVMIKERDLTFERVKKLIIEKVKYYGFSGLKE